MHIPTKIIIFGAALSGSLVASAASPTAPGTSRMPNYARAYNYALRCFVANNRDIVAQKVAYDAALKLGRLQGLSDQRINKDFNWTIANENIRLARSESYRAQLLGECRQIGMAS